MAAKGVRMLKEKLSTSKRQLVTLPNYPDESLSGVPDKIEGEVMTKRARKRRFYMKKRYFARVIEGVMRLSPPKRQKSTEALEGEFTIDLAKVDSVMHDDRRIIFKFPKESLIVTPVDRSMFENWIEAVTRHRLFRQQRSMSENSDDDENQRDRSTTTTATANSVDARSTRSSRSSGRSSVTGLPTFSDNTSTWDRESVAKTMEDIQQMQMLSIEILEKCTRSYEEMRKTARELRSAAKEVKALVQTKHGVSATVPLPTANAPTKAIVPQNAAAKQAVTTSGVSAIIPSTASPQPPLLALAQTQVPSPNVEEDEEEDEEDEEEDEAKEDQQKDEKLLKEQLPKAQGSSDALLSDPRLRAKNLLRSLRSRQGQAGKDLLSSGATKSTSHDKVQQRSKRTTSDDRESEKSDKKEVVATTRHHRRTTLPSEQCEGEALGFRTIYNLTVKRSGLPLSMYEPLGILQAMCEQMRFSNLLDRAAKSSSPDERIGLITAFATSFYLNTYGRYRKPFNPLLGESFDYQDRGFRYHAEQVSYHPLISAAHAEGRGWLYMETFAPEFKISAMSSCIDATCDRPVRVRIGKEDYYWTKIRTRIEGLMQVPEQRKLYHDGTIHVRCSNGYGAKVTFKDKKNREFSGELFNKSKQSIGSVSGNWSRAIYVQQNGGERELLAQTDSPAKDYYGFSPFTMGLNELHDDESAHLPPTDSRFRPDMRELENGNVEQATANKSALEKAQKSRKSPASVLWFREHEDEYTRKKVYRSNGRYWNAKQNGFKSQKNGKLFTNIFEI